MSEASIRQLPVWNGEIQIEPLEGGITNVNYRVTDGGARYAVRTGADDPALGISRRNELDCTRLAADLGIAPALAYAASGVLVSAFVDGTPLTPELATDRARLARVVQQLRRIHAAGESIAGHLRYFSVFQVARTYVELARERALALPGEDAESLLREVEDLQAQIAPFIPTFCHNDLMPGNLLDSGDRVWVIDWEYAGIGHPLFDLAGLASNCEFGEARDRALLREYYGADDDDVARQFRVMKAMAALRESLWAVVQGAQSEIDFDYAGYRDDNYRKFRDAIEAI